jgi:membrane protein implicated in regulation of membrane protease activity
MFETLSTWFSSLDSTMRLFWACAIAASIVFILQNALMLMGIGDMDSDADADMSTDFDTSADTDLDIGHSGHDGTLGSAGVFSLFTLRNFINFFLGFGWGGISFASAISSKTLLVLVAFVCGLIFVAVFVLILRAFLKLEHNGSFSITDCVGQTASVYLRIPANHAASGKVQISINGSIHELDAFTDGEFLPTGTRVRIVSVIDSGSLLVEKL